MYELNHAFIFAFSAFIFAVIDMHLFMCLFSYAFMVAFCLFKNSLKILIVFVPEKYNWLKNFSKSKSS